MRGDYFITPSFQCTRLEISTCSRLESSSNHSVRIKAPLKMPVGPLLDMEAMPCVFTTCIPRGFGLHCFPIQVTHFGFHPFIWFFIAKSTTWKTEPLKSCPSDVLAVDLHLQRIRTLLHPIYLPFYFKIAPSSSLALKSFFKTKTE